MRDAMRTNWCENKFPIWFPICRDERTISRIRSGNDVERQRENENCQMANGVGAVRMFPLILINLLSLAVFRLSFVHHRQGKKSNDKLSFADQHSCVCVGSNENHFLAVSVCCAVQHQRNIRWTASEEEVDVGMGNAMSDGEGCGNNDGHRAIRSLSLSRQIEKCKRHAATHNTEMEEKTRTFPFVFWVSVVCATRQQNERTCIDTKFTDRRVSAANR